MTSKSTLVQRLCLRRNALLRRLRDEIMARLHPEAEALEESARMEVAAEAEAEIAEALARWRETHRDGPVKAATWLQRYLDLCRRLEQRIADIEDTETDVEVRQLARLSRAAYDRCKSEKAKQLGIDVRTLNQLVDRARLEPLAACAAAIAPWPMPVDGATLLTEIAAALRRYVVMTEHEARAIALWIIHCHALEASSVSPRLIVRSATMRSGKTTLRDVVAALVPKPLCSDNVSVATIFRATNQDQPTLLLDEFDVWAGRDPQIRGIINSGHRQGGFVLRTINGKATPFKTFAPMMLAGIGRVPGTIEDRGIQIVLRRRRPDDPCEPFRPDRTNHVDGLGRRAARWAADHLGALTAADPLGPAILNDRAADNWRPLLAIADEAGPEWGQWAREAAAALAQVDNEPTTDECLIHDIGAVLASIQSDRISSEELVAQLVKLEGAPWAEWRAARPLSKHQLARLLRPFGIQPTTIRVGDKTIKGYFAAQFEDALLRYGPRSVRKATS
jgi:Protein of unknown function (DUF3631)